MATSVCLAPAPVVTTRHAGCVAAPRTSARLFQAIPYPCAHPMRHSRARRGHVALALSGTEKVSRVADIMTAKTVISVEPTTTVLEALKLLKEHRITGMPVLDPSRGNRVCGVVSDFDLIALDAVSGTRDVSLFPEPGEDWVVFKNLQRLVTKTTATTVGEVMTDEPFVVTPDCSVEKAARLLLEKRLRRLPVVESEESMQLVGIVSRADIVDAAIKTMGL